MANTLCTGYVIQEPMHSVVALCETDSSRHRLGASSSRELLCKSRCGQGDFHTAIKIQTERADLAFDRDSRLMTISITPVLSTLFTNRQRREAVNWEADHIFRRMCQYAAKSDSFRDLLRLLVMLWCLSQSHKACFIWLWGCGQA